MSDIYLKTKADVSSFLNVLVEESLNKAKQDIKEKQKQDYFSKELSSLYEQDDEEKKEAEPKEAEPKEAEPKEAEPKEAKADSGQGATLQTIIDKVNQLRSGKSLRDATVSKSMGDYFNNLSASEKIALNKFLDGLTSFIVGDEPGTTAERPADALKISKKEDDQQSKTKGASPDQPTVDPGKEDTSPPIKVGESYTRALRDYAKSLMVS